MEGVWKAVVGLKGWKAYDFTHQRGVLITVMTGGIIGRVVGWVGGWVKWVEDDGWVGERGGRGWESGFKGFHPSEERLRCVDK